jgi:hypothetical protein
VYSLCSKFKFHFHSLQRPQKHDYTTCHQL